MEMENTFTTLSLQVSDSTESVLLNLAHRLHPHVGFDGPSNVHLSCRDLRHHRGQEQADLVLEHRFADRCLAEDRCRPRQRRVDRYQTAVSHTFTDHNDLQVTYRVGMTASWDHSQLNYSGPPYMVLRPSWHCLAGLG